LNDNDDEDDDDNGEAGARSDQRELQQVADAEIVLQGRVERQFTVDAVVYTIARETVLWT